jgi:hypothetical protein
MVGKIITILESEEGRKRLARRPIHRPGSANPDGTHFSSWGFNQPEEFNQGRYDNRKGT